MQLALKSGKVKTNGSGSRKLESWMRGHSSHETSGLEPRLSPFVFGPQSPPSPQFLSQRVWIKTTRHYYPNLYVLIVGHPGVSKTTTIREARTSVIDLPDFHLAPVSHTFASLVDALVRSKRMVIRLPDSPLEYNSMSSSLADELGAFIHKYASDKMVAEPQPYHDPDAYSQTRRTHEINIKIKSPQT